MNGKNALVPAPFRIARRTQELEDTVTFHLDCAARPLQFRPGQFNMLYVFGVGEVAISLSGDPAHPAEILHTVRAVGAVTRVLCRMQPGERLGVRGPFGAGWPLERCAGKDVIVVAGGLGLAPLRPAILHLLANRGGFGRVAILYGSRTPKDLLFADELAGWQARTDVSIALSVDRAEREFHGHVGVVTELISELTVSPTNTVGLLCGPEVMMRFAARALEKKGVPRDAIYVSLERNMKCAVGFCGHCQLGPAFVCKDGPVFGYDRAADLLQIREL
jgi:NAD(P)H-flavin reductase